MARIQTGVDKLVALIKDKQKVDLSDAAKQLGVSKTIVQEWADFLEEEGIIELKYSFAKTYLVDKKVTKTEAAQRERQFEQQRETFIGKVDQTIQSVEHESKGFEEFRKEFVVLKKNLSQNLAQLHEELGTLHSLEHSKRRATTSLATEHNTLKRKEANAKKALTREHARFVQIQRSLASQQRSLAEHKRAATALLRSENAVNKKLAVDAAQAAKLRHSVEQETKALRDGERALKALDAMARAARKELAQVERTKLQPLRVEKERIAQKTRILEERILAKARAERAHAKKPSGTTTKTRRSIEELFKRKKSIEHLLESIERDKHALIDELDELGARAEAFRVGKNAAKLEELRKKLAHLEHGRKKLQSHLADFIKLLRKP
jgi:hypothetical protein